MKSDPPRILFILHLPPPLHGPAVIGEYIKHSDLINNCFDCHFLNLSISASINDLGSTSSSKFLRFLKLIWDVKKQLIFNRPDLCYITLNSIGSGFYKDSVIALLIKLFRVKRVYHFHNKGITNRKICFFEDLLYKLVFRGAEVILISKSLYYDFKRYVPENRIHYCTNGIPDKRLQAKRNGQPAPGTLCSLLFFSNLIESKGLYILLDACKMLNEKNLDFKCIIAGRQGDISPSQLMNKIEVMGLAGHINYAAEKSGYDKEQLFSSADVFVHPTFSDCLPLVILEAMQHSLPVVSTFEGAIPDAVDDGISGILVPVKDPSALAEKLEFLIINPETRIKMGSAGRKKYEREFTLEKFEKRLTEILSDIAVNVK